MKWLTKNALWLWAAFVLVVMFTHSQNARGETNVFVGAWSKHITGTKDRNENHDLVAVEHNGWIAGTFENSHFRETWFAGHKWAWKYKGLEAGIIGGAMRGYTACFTDGGDSSVICPLAVPYATWEAGPVNPVVMLMGDALAVSIRISL